MTTSLSKCGWWFFYWLEIYWIKEINLYLLVSTCILSCKVHEFPLCQMDSMFHHKKGRSILLCCQPHICGHNCNHDQLISSAFMTIYFCFSWTQHNGTWDGLFCPQGTIPVPATWDDLACNKEHNIWDMSFSYQTLAICGLYRQLKIQTCGRLCSLQCSLPMWRMHSKEGLRSISRYKNSHKLSC